ncbi:tetratricopeptide repeat protein [Rubripirellula sp.]|nr:tetratricopeptide repeat protein [Rubripirellula sp.]MDB4624518.1 tetratricopeptide repeat protein [Rubripirellula sp.]
MAELWWRGRLSALPAAIAFTLIVNLILVARYLYPGWIHSGLVSLAFWGGLIALFFYILRTARELPALINPRDTCEEPDQFPEARIAYLGGRWEEAEGLLTDVLAIEPRDPPALLLLTGVYRHTGRLEAAVLLLREISRLEAADDWRLEIETESKRLTRASEAENTSEQMDTKNHVSETKNAA